jgi:hypothetical protein
LPTLQNIEVKTETISEFLRGFANKLYAESPETHSLDAYVSSQNYSCKNHKLTADVKKNTYD